MDALTNDSRKYHVAILDIRMPEMSGFQLARRLWQQNGDLQICFMSAFQINETEARLTMPGLRNHCFLTEPLTPAVVARHIESHFADQSIIG